VKQAAGWHSSFRHFCVLSSVWEARSWWYSYSE
jgi:hypothetical protein